MSSRPLSGKVRPESGHQNGTLKSQTDEVLSYEDLLVAQYLEELKHSNSARPSAKTTSSPYLSKLGGSRPSSSHVIPSRRPLSAQLNGTREHTCGKPKMDPKFIADPDLWDPATPREHQHNHHGTHRRARSAKNRPVSSPVYKRPWSSSTYSSTTSSRPSTVRRNKPLYKRQPYTIVVLAFRNGCRDNFAKLAAPSIKVLLEMATDKLGLPTAGRRVFLDDGSEVFTPREIPRDSEVYISCGEPFKNPLKAVKCHNNLTKDCAWTMNGLVWTQDEASTKRRGPRSHMSKRFRALIEQSRRRVLVFKNGQGTQGVEIVADPSRFEDFLVACTAKCELGSYAKVLYDWDGNEVTNLEQAPILDKCLQTWSTPALGPLWVSKGEFFSPSGVVEFLSGLIKYTRAKLFEAKHYKKQLLLGQSDETKPQVEIVAILSMTETEIDETVDIVDKDIDEFDAALKRLKAQVSKLQPEKQEEDVKGNNYKLGHIPLLYDSAKLRYLEEKSRENHVDTKELQRMQRIRLRKLGKGGLKLKVYENGSYENETIFYFNLRLATRGAETKEQIMNRFLDECSASSALSNPVKSPQIRPVAKKIFNKIGSEVDDIFSLKNEQEIWLSFGEPWKNPFTFVLGMQVDKVRLFEIEEENMRRTGIREQLMNEDMKDQDKTNQWEVVEGIPADYSNISSVTTPEEKDYLMGLLQTGEIPADRLTLLRNKDAPETSLLFPELFVTNKQSSSEKKDWPPESQIFLISQDGYIRSKALPQLVLTALIDCNIKTFVRKSYNKGNTNVEVEGPLVTFARKGGRNAAGQTWAFTKDGLIRLERRDLFLTCLGSQYEMETDPSKRYVLNSEGTTTDAQGLYFCATGKIEGRMAKAQRFAMKQERFDNLGQWKFTRVENPEWNKRALSWPMTEEGEYNKDYDWPMEGFLLPYAPPLKKQETKTTTNVGQVSLRLVVLKNGVRDISKAVPVVGPDLTNMKKDTQNKKKPKRKQQKEKEKNGVVDTVQEDEALSVLKLEFILFLERCTTMLDLPFAARRLFDETGKEHYSLVHLKRDQLVYVSCGEAWNDPTLSKAEQQRRFLLSNLASDVAQIRHYVSLRHADNLVLQVAESLTAGAELILGECALNPEKEAEEERHQRLYETERQEREAEKRRQKEEMEELLKGKMTAHEHSHQRADERLQGLKWPWERIINKDIEEDDDPEEQHYSNKEMYRRFKPKKKKTDEDLLQLQKFIYQDGRLVCSGNFDLVLGVKETESGRGQVLLVKQRPDDIMQCWNLQPNGLIQFKHNPTLVLTAGMPSSLQDEEPGFYVGCQVQVQRRKTAQFGRANQRWFYDESTGLIKAFHTDRIDKEITAANRANVCTFAVMGATEIDQPGYVVEIQTEKGAKPKRLLVCSSCARAMRGRHKLEKVTDNVDFACAMGSAKDHGVKQVGSFQCLNGKVDLSQFEAEHTLEQWEEQLDRLKDELSVRAIAKDIYAARAPYTVKVLAYRNGEGRLQPGELIVGSSVLGILEQSSTRLSLPQAARRLYVRDGTLVLDVDDLVEWARQEYARQARREIRRGKREKKEREAKEKEEEEEGEAGETLMDRVELDSDDATTEEEEDEEEKEEEGEEAEEEGEEDEDKKYAIGNEVRDQREHCDGQTNILVVPNPSQKVSNHGVIENINFYTTAASRITFLVLRPTEGSDSDLQIAHVFEANAPSRGEHSIDCEIPAQKGDLLGFVCKDAPVVPFDIDTELPDDYPLYTMSEDTLAPGDLVPMQVWLQEGARVYSLMYTFNAVLNKNSKGPQTRMRPKSAKRHTSEATKGKGQKDPTKGKKKGPYVELPPVDMVLKYPIEVWISTGENFIKPEKVENDHETSVKFREERAKVAFELDKEKHVLRHMTGRRYDKMAPGAFKGTSNPSQPVYRQGHWQEVTLDELAKHDAVHQLQSHLTEVKAAQRRKSGIRTCNVSTTRRLYTVPAMKRALVFPVGDSIERAQYVWGENLEQLLDNCTTRLTLQKPAKFLFTLEGEQVNHIDDFERDQLICAAPNKQFLMPKEGQLQIEVKANWGRARKRYGPHATDVIATSSKNPDIDVDPFGPSALAGGPTRPQRNTYPSSHK